MPVNDRNPFGPSTPEESKADIGVSDPLAKPPNVVKCPVCEESRAEQIATHNTPTQILRTCKTCGNKWSCGNVGGLIPVEHTGQVLTPEPPDPEEDIPPDFRLSGTDEWFD